MRKPRVAVVTGASRGAGKGIALALADTGATVYVTGRTVQEGSNPLPGTVQATAAEIDRRGGTGIPVVCDHSRDEEVAALFERVAQEHGRLDILVNNAFVVPDGLTGSGPFWERPLDLTRMFDVGLRSTYVASYYAAPLLTADPARAALLVNTSGFGGGCYMHGPAYGAVKAGVDKMAHDMAVDLRPYGVTAISLWMGLLRTERTMRVLEADPQRYGDLSANTESPELAGRVIAALDRSPGKLEHSGRVLVAAELAAQLSVTDVDGRAPRSRRPVLGDPIRYNPAVVG